MAPAEAWAIAWGMSGHPHNAVQRLGQEPATPGRGAAAESPLPIPNRGGIASTRPAQDAPLVTAQAFSDPIFSPCWVPPGLTLGWGTEP